MHCGCYPKIPGAKLVAVCDVDKKRIRDDWTGPGGNIEGGKLDLKGTEKYSDFDELLANDDIDMVDICTPTFLHAEMTIKALKAGKHVFCEKPMAMDTTEARRMIAAAKKAKRQLMIGHCLRFWEEYLAIEKMIKDKTYGKVRSVVATRLGGAPVWSWDGWLQDPKRGGYAALDLHIHDVDTIQWLFGMPSAVTAVGRIDGELGLNHVITQYHYDKGPAVVAEGGFLPPSCGFTMALRVYFEKAYADFNIGQTPTLTVYPQKGKPKAIKVYGKDAYHEELKYFIDCLNKKRKATRIPVESSLNSVKLVHAELRSVKSGKKVAIR
jgi:predicted dehydrogenase